MNSFKKVLNYTKKYWKHLLISGITASFYGIFSAAPTYIVKYTVDEVFVKKISSLLIPFICCFILIFALKGLFMYLSNYYMNYVGNKVVNDIRNDLFQKVINFPISFYQKKTTGQLMSHFLNDIQMIQNASSSAIKNGVRSLFEAIFLLAVAFTQNWKLAFLMLLVGPIIGFIISKMGKAIKKASISIQQNIGTLSSHLQEVFIGIREIKAFNGEKLEINRFNKYLNLCFNSIMKNVQIDSLGPSLIETIAMIFGGGLVFYVAAIQIMNGSISPGQLTAFFASILLAYQPLKRLINVYSEVQYGLAAAERVFDLMDKVYPSSQIQITETIINKNNLNTNTNSAIVFENLYFEYEENKPILNSINLEIKKSERIGLIGASGTGKSTLCDLLLGFISPKTGSIYINDKNIALLSLEELRNKIGYVGQKTFLFNDSVYANVTYSQENKTEQDVINACQMAHADEFIQKLPEKYDTCVGENGSKISGGQKQRLTIARALLKNPEILILDEATSSLDNESEEMIRLALEEINREKTIIVVSHRLSFIEKMDRIFMLKDGILQEISKNQLESRLYI